MEECERSDGGLRGGGSLRDRSIAMSAINWQLKAEAKKAPDPNEPTFLPPVKILSTRFSPKAFVKGKK
jgi:hypothetical protein